MRVYMIYDEETNYPVHGMESVDTVRVFAHWAKAEAVAQGLNSACEYPPDHDLHAHWTVSELEVE